LSRFRVKDPVSKLIATRDRGSKMGRTEGGDSSIKGGLVKGVERNDGKRGLRGGEKGMRAEIGRKK